MIKKALLTVSPVLALLMEQGHAGHTQIQFEGDENSSVGKHIAHFKSYDGTEKKGLFEQMSQKVIAGYGIYALSPEESYQKGFPELSFEILQHLLSGDITFDTVVGKTFPYKTSDYDGFLQIRGISFINIGDNPITYKHLKNMINKQEKESVKNEMDTFLKILKEGNKDKVLAKTNVHKEGEKTTIHYYLKSEDNAYVITAMRNKNNVFPELTAATMRLANFSLIDTDLDSAKITSEVSQELDEEGKEEDKASIATQDTNSQDGLDDFEIASQNFSEEKISVNQLEDDEEDLSEAFRSLWQEREEQDVLVENQQNHVEDRVASNDDSIPETTISIPSINEEPSILFEPVEDHLDEETVFKNEPVQIKTSDNVIDTSQALPSEESSISLNTTNISLPSVWQDQGFILQPDSKNVVNRLPKIMGSVKTEVIQNVPTFKSEPVIKIKPVAYSINKAVKKPVAETVTSKNKINIKPLKKRVILKKKSSIIKKKVIKRNISIKKHTNKNVKKKISYKKNYFRSNKIINRHLVKSKNINKAVKNKFISNLNNKKIIKRVKIVTYGKTRVNR